MDKMEELVDTFCKLCRNVISGEDFKTREEITSEVLDVLFLKLSAQEKNILAKCNICSTKLFEAFNFKAICIATEDCIFPYVNSESKVPIDLREIYLKEKGKELLQGVLEDERVCRLCMLVTSEFTAVDEMDVDTFCRYIPEVNFNSIKEPVICKICLDLLAVHTSFLNQFLNIKEEINDICDNDATESMFSIKCEVLEIKSEETFRGTAVTNLRNDYVDCTSQRILESVKSTNSSLIKGTKKQHESKHKCQNRCVKRNQLKQRQMYKCDKGDFKTRHKHYVKQHQLRHEVIPEEQMYKCGSCDYKTNQRRYLKRHQLKHKDIAEEQMYKWDYKTDQKRYLRRRGRRHGEQDLNPTKQSVISKVSDDSLDTQTNVLNNCSNVKVEVEDVDDEARQSVSNIKCEDIEIKSEENYNETLFENLKDEPVDEKSCDQPECIKVDINPSAEEMYKCDICDYKTRWKNVLKRHLLKHKDILSEQMYKCDLCDYKSIYKHNLAQHHRRHNNIPEEQMYKCDSCDYKSIYKYYLARHLRLHKKIPEEQKYKCDSCDYKSIYKCYLARHQLLHKKVPEEQMYKCLSCDYKSIYKYYLARHQRQHRKVPEEQMYKCDSCDYKTIYRSALTQHVLGHKNIPAEQMYKCDLCDYRTRYKRHLKRHELSQTHLRRTLV